MTPSFTNADRAASVAADKILIAEIPLPILAKLKRNSLLLVVILLALELMCGRTAFAGTSFGSAYRLVLDVAAIGAGIGFVLSIFKYPILVGRELQYRKRQGTWRWDR